MVLPSPRSSNPKRPSRSSASGAAVLSPACKRWESRPAPCHAARHPPNQRYNLRMHSLESLARQFFGELTVAEVELVKAAPLGRFAVCGPSQDDTDPANHPRNANSWTVDRQIRAELVRWICRHPGALDAVDPRGIQIYGARLIGVLDLSELHVPFRLALFRCRATDEMLFRAIEIPLLAFDGSWVGAVKADAAEVKGGVTLRNGFRADQQVRMHRARIGVDLDCGGGTFVNPARKGVLGSGSALAADGATFGGGVFLNNGFHAEGEVRFSRSYIRGDLDCCRATFLNRPYQEGVGFGTALNADGITVAGSVFLRESLAEGEIRIPRGKVGADIDCSGATIVNPFGWGPSGSAAALTAEGSAVGGNIVLNNQFHARGFVTLRGAQVAGQLICNGATFENVPALNAPVSMVALDASLANIASGVFLGYKFRAEGEVRLQSARIGTVLDCDGGVFHNPPQANMSASGYAITADGVRVSGRVGMGRGFRADGEVFIIGAQIEGDLDCGSGEFNNPAVINDPHGGRALSAHRVKVGGNAYIRDGFFSRGEVSFSGASIQGNLEGTSAKFDGELSLESSTVEGALMLSTLVEPERLKLTLTNASVGALADDAAGWPAAGKLLLDGFVYARFSGPAPKDHNSRLKWLARQLPFVPQPYQQVAKVLREEGEAAGSVEVLYEMEHQVRGRDTRWWRTHLVNPTLRWTVGYGYYPARAFWWLAGIILLGFGLYGIGYHVGSITPIDKDAYAAFKCGRQLPAHYERFHAFIYSVENSLPFVKLGQVDHWQADPDPQNPVWRLQIQPFTVWLCLAGLLRWYAWLQILSGWVLGTLFIAGVTGIIRKD